MGENSNTKAIVRQALSKMLADDEKINISQVAAKSGVSHSLIYNRYPDLAYEINQAKERQKNKRHSIEASQEVEMLKQQVTNLKQSVVDYEQVAKSYREQNEELWEHIQQVYGMYDQVLAERNGFAERLKVMK